MTVMDPDLVHRLSSGEGWGLLQSLPPYDEALALRTATRLREAGFEADLVSAALTQSRLRARARAKFGDEADQMLFTADGLEQATRAPVAERHAARLRAAGAERVWDLGCGIGADAMAMARAGMTVCAVETDPTTAEVARVNLRRWPGASVVLDRAEAVRLPSGEAARDCAVWFDPARRLPGAREAQGQARRVFRLDQLSPAWDLVRGIAASVPAAGAKLGPGFPHVHIPPETEAQWTSYGGEVLECTLWWGAAVRTPGRTASVHTPSGWVEIPTRDGPHAVLTGPAQLGSWVYEPDKAVLQAGLVGALTEAVRGSELDGGVGYVSSERAVELPWARRYRLIETMPLHVKGLRAWARGLDLGRLTIKKRGVRLDADDLRRQLRLRGRHEATVMITRVGGRPFVLHVTP